MRKPLSPGSLIRWGQCWDSYPSLWGYRAHMLAQEGRQRPVGGGQRLAELPQARERGSRDGSCRRGCPLSHCLPSPLGALSSGLEWPLPGSGFIIPCQALGNLWEPGTAVQPTESRPEHWVRSTLRGHPDPGSNPASATHQLWDLRQGNPPL